MQKYEKKKQEQSTTNMRYVTNCKKEPRQKYTTNEKKLFFIFLLINQNFLFLVVEKESFSPNAEETGTYVNNTNKQLVYKNVFTKFTK